MDCSASPRPRVSKSQSPDIIHRLMFEMEGE